jgi:voltage-gated potassium channel
LSSVNFKKHIILAGWNWNAENILEILFKNLNDTEIVIVNDLKPEEATVVLDKFKQYDLKFIKGDFANLQVLERANINEAKFVMILPDNSIGLTQNVDEKTIFTLMTIKSVSEKIKVYAQLLDKDKISHIERAKADGYFLSDKHLPFFMAANILSPGLNDVLDCLLNYNSENHFKIVNIPDAFIGKSFEGLSRYFRNDSGSILFAIVQLQDVLKIKNIDVKDTTSIDAFIKRKFEEAGRLAKDLSNKKIIINPADDYILNENEYAVIISAPK